MVKIIITIISIIYVEEVLDLIVSRDSDKVKLKASEEKVVELQEQIQFLHQQLQVAHQNKVSLQEALAEANKQGILVPYSRKFWRELSLVNLAF